MRVVRGRRRPHRGLAWILISITTFTVALLGFSAYKHSAKIPLPVQGTITTETTAAPAAQGEQGGATAKLSEGNWAQNLLSMEASSARAVQSQPQGEDPDWPMEDESTDDDSQQTHQDQTPITPIVTKGKGPVVMLYSTHSNESYRKVDGQNYRESSNSRTLDANYNILRVNSELSNLLSQTYKLPIYFDNTDNELGKYYTTSYERSLARIEASKKEYETLSVFFDIHRDSSGPAGVGDVVKVDGKDCAKIMFVVGTGEGKTGQGFKVRPNWQSNKKLADAIAAEINAAAPGLCRGVRVKTGRYNQHVSNAALAIEVGHNQNTLQEVLNSIPYLAKAMATVLTRDLGVQPTP